MDDEERELEEPIEKVCRSCMEGGYIEEMVDCPKCEEDMEEKGVVPGWVHKSCCENLFLEDPEGCSQCCGNDEFTDNVKAHFDACVKLENLKKSTTKEGIDIFMPKTDYYIITAQADKLIEPFKPINVVADTFSDLEEELLYVKDNHVNIVA